ncbi:MAG: hypothetical protein ABGW50_05405 [Thermococcus sp.]
MAEVIGTLKIEDGYVSIEITQEAIQKLFDDRQVLKRLIELDIAEKEHILARMKEFIREVLEEEKKYDFDVEKYPQELIKKIQQAEGLDDEIYELEEEIAVLGEILHGIESEEMAEEMAKSLEGDGCGDVEA